MAAPPRLSCVLARGIPKARGSRWDGVGGTALGLFTEGARRKPDRGAVLRLQPGCARDSTECAYICSTQSPCEHARAHTRIRLAATQYESLTTAALVPAVAELRHGQATPNARARMGGQQPRRGRAAFTASVSFDSTHGNLAAFEAGDPAPELEKVSRHRERERVVWARSKDAQ